MDSDDYRGLRMRSVHDTRNLRNAVQDDKLTKRSNRRENVIPIVSSVKPKVYCRLNKASRIEYSRMVCTLEEVFPDKIDQCVNE